ncbi:MalY/PatB family protein [Streptomyces sp. KE1]|uniref:MalY/PatB family protein n=1 Tax=Streptomyces sp. KE1 TaxID=1638939 RepID=UPI00063EBD14|nr:aminotransferase class I/II-fold pyridoxal phosphate-dependent enzyme [Streptomyces sp. KE1]KLJ04071.1 bifunctional beta-cystathionase/maltose regulon regulatory protein [Streptomyces sp. KE1]
MSFDFDTPVDRYGTWSVQWDGVADRFGVDGLLPFTISDMDFPSAPVLLDALHQRISHGVFGYTDWRLGDFRPAVAHWFATRHDTTVDTDRLVYAPSVLNQLSQLLRMWTEPGDEVVLHTPTYDGFRKAVDGLGRVRVPAPLDDPEFRVLEGLLARERARVLLLCSPHNPTGKVWSAEELTALAALARRHGVAVISDEIHADFVHPGRRHLPWTRFGGEGERWALVTSGSKAFNFPALTGSYGFLGNAEDHAAFVRRMETGEGLASPAALSLTAHIAAYRHGAPWLDAARAYIAGNLGLLADRLDAAFPELGWTPPEAGYLAWIDLRPLGVDEDALQRILVEREKVAVMRGSVYDAPGFVRLNMGCSRAKAEAGIDALIRALRG